MPGPHREAWGEGGLDKLGESQQLSTSWSNTVWSSSGMEWGQNPEGAVLKGDVEVRK